jgi:hypothetical protein
MTYVNLGRSATSDDSVVAQGRREDARSAPPPEGAVVGIDPGVTLGSGVDGR